MGLLGNLLKGISLGAQFIPGAGPFIASGLNIAGDIASNTEGARTSKFEQTREGTTTPILSSEFQETQGDIGEAIRANLQLPTGIQGLQGDISALEESGLERVNRVAELTGSSIARNVRARGLGSSSISALSEASSGQARAGALSSLLGQIAQLRLKARIDEANFGSQIRQRRILSGTNFLRSLPVGQETNQTISGTSTRAGSALGAGLQSAGAEIGSLSGLFGGNRNTSLIPTDREEEQNMSLPRGVR